MIGIAGGRLFQAHYFGPSLNMGRVVAAHGSQGGIDGKGQGMARPERDRVDGTEINASQAEIFENPLALKKFPGFGVKGGILHGERNQQTLETTSFLFKIQRKGSLSSADKAYFRIISLCTPYAKQRSKGSAGGKNRGPEIILDGT